MTHSLLVEPRADAPGLSASDVSAPTIHRGQSAPVVIEARGLSKQFVLRSGAVGDLRERFQDVWSLVRRRPKQDDRTFLALQDINFQVTAGQTLGIVGHNGSGKSTLLKLLTGILKPTTGTLKMHGRVGALIEVGAGFHPDLSGRENIYLNGSILGLSRRDIDRRMDDIISFAGLEKFIDTPVKRYSSGMYMRLGFSVAAHTDPDILLIDEVLAVGDSQFQRKCIRHLKEFAARGGTVVFVSHAMGQVVELCETCLWLDHGQVLYQGDAQQAIERYMALVAEREDEEYKRSHPEDWAEREAERARIEEAERLAREEAEQAEREALEAAQEQERSAEQARQDAEAARLAKRALPAACRLEGVTLRDRTGRARNHFIVGEPVRVEIACHWGRPLPAPVVGVDFYRDDGLHMHTTSNWDHQFSLAGMPTDSILTLELERMTLNQGRYRVQVKLFSDTVSSFWWDHPEDTLECAAQFEVTGGQFKLGVAYVPTHWHLPDGRILAGKAVSDRELQTIEAQNTCAGEGGASGE